MRWLERLQKGPDNPSKTAQNAIVAAKAATDVFISTCDERAQVEAEMSALRHKKDCRLSPLDGVPVAWKDNIDLKGVVTTVACPQGKDERVLRAVHQLSTCKKHL